MRGIPKPQYWAVCTIVPNNNGGKIEGWCRGIHIETGIKNLSSIHLFHNEGH